MNLKQFLDKINSLNLTDEQLENCNISIETIYLDNHDMERYLYSNISDISYNKRKNILEISADEE